MSNEENSFEYLMSQRTQQIMMSTQFNQGPHVMPCPPNLPWNANAMPWAMPAPPVNEIIEFKGLNPSMGINKQPNQCKRKSDLEPLVPKKQLITEEKMAAHLNGLHISHDYISHNTAASDGDPVLSISTGDFSMDADLDNNTVITITAKELEERIKSGGRLIINEEIKNIKKTDEVIPKALLNRIETPCKALVLWQPPLTHGISISPTKTSDDDSDEEDSKRPQDTNTMDLDP